MHTNTRESSTRAYYNDSLNIYVLLYSIDIEYIPPITCGPYSLYTLHLMHVYIYVYICRVYYI